jgi:hypothetical protein
LVLLVESSNRSHDVVDALIVHGVCTGKDDEGWKCKGTVEIVCFLLFSPNIWQALDFCSEIQGFLTMVYMLRSCLL